jgi:hypothetical protein
MMFRNLRVVLIAAVVLALCGGIGIASARPQGGGERGGAETGRGHGGGRGEQGGPHEGRLKGSVVFGDITAISSSSVTLAPGIPPHMAERAEAEGFELPKLPASVSLSFTDESRFFLMGEKSSAADFAVGDTVVVRADGNSFEEQASVKMMGDPESLRQFARQHGRRGERGGHGGPGWQGMMGGPDEGEGEGWGGHGEGPGLAGAEGRPGRGKGKGGRGHGGPAGLEGQPLPLFGEVISVSGDTVKLRPLLPDFIVKQAEKMDIGIHVDQPDEVSITLSERTKFFVDGERQDSLPFNAGDKVTVLLGPKFWDESNDNAQVAFVVSDWATTEKRIAQMEKKREGKGKGKGKKGKRGRGKRGQEDLSEQSQKPVDPGKILP